MSVVSGGLVLVIVWVVVGGGRRLCGGRGVGGFDEVEGGLLRFAELAGHRGGHDDQEADHREGENADSEERRRAVVPGLRRRVPSLVVDIPAGHGH